ncbi:MAG: hypothetical protein JEZ08_00770 [Clostridiales bacterium]|nr:hypothetical protein [Clostridiales bacterium]
MSYILKLEIQTICTVHIIAIIISIIGSMMLYIKTDRDDSVKAFLVMQTSIILWMVFKIFKTIAPTVSLRWGFIVLYYACVCILEVAFLEFAYGHYKGKRIPIIIRYILYMFPMIQITMIAMNPLHHMFYKTFDFFGDTFGILFYVHFIIEYAFIIAGSYYCVLTFRKEFMNKKLIYRYMISSAIVFPMIMNLLYVSKVFHKFLRTFDDYIIFDVTPIVFTWSGLLFVYATFKHNFFNISPIMKHEIIHKLDTPIVVLDSAYDMVYKNEKFELMLEDITVDIFEGFLKVYRKGNYVREQEVTYNGRYFMMFLKTIASFKETEHILIIRDITNYRKVEHEINNEQNKLIKANDELREMIETLKELSKVGARSYVARELHDIVGHSLVVTIKLLEVSNLYYNCDKQLSLDALRDAISTIELGIGEMKTIKEPDNISYSGDTLKKDLNKMLEHVERAGIKTNLSFKGVYSKLDEQIYLMIKKICTELMTNALKHSKATELFISIQIRHTKIELLVIDNGIGHAKVVKGNGLTGIEERLRSLEGKVRFNTSEGEGFISKIIIPLKRELESLK